MIGNFGVARHAWKNANGGVAPVLRDRRVVTREGRRLHPAKLVHFSTFTTTTNQHSYLSHDLFYMNLHDLFAFGRYVVNDILLVKSWSTQL
jgi:hypothetical protein